MTNDTGSDGRLSRRRFVGIIGATGITATLAGCGGQEATDGNGNGGNGNGASGNGNGGNGNGNSEPSMDLGSSRTMIQELAYITNQTMPVLPLQEKLAQSFQSTDGWDVPPADSDKTQVYWPTEWLPREGDWTATGDDDRLTLAPVGRPRRLPVQPLERQELR
jgi:peptide/nickel transport system substrate-binding protein